MSESAATVPDWTDRRKRARWALDMTGMAKSGYAPLKDELALWVVEAATEIERLQAKLAGIENVLRVARVGRNSRPDDTLAVHEAWARKGQDDVLEMIEEALRVF